MTDETGQRDANGGSAPAASLRERLRTPAAVIGYVAFFAAFALTFVSLLLKGMWSWWNVTGYLVLATGVVFGIAVNYDRALGLFTSRKAAAGMSVALAVAAGTVMLVVANYVGYKWHFRIDITEQKRFSLTEKTKNWLRKLDSKGRELRIATFLSYRSSQGRGVPENLREQVMDLLELYRERSRLVRVTHTSLARPDETLEVASKFGIPARRIPSETVVFKYGPKRRDIHVTSILQLVRLREGMPPEALFRGEDAFTSAIRDLIEGEPRKLYFVTGHGERSTGTEGPDYGLVFSRVEGMNFEIEQVDIAQNGGVPDDADCLVVAGPTRSFLTAESGFDELAAIEKYLAKGGRLLVFVDNLITNPDHKPSGIERVLEKYGVVVRQNAVSLGPELRYVNATQGIPSKKHEITAPLAASGAWANLYRACCLGTRVAAHEGYAAVRILEGSPGSWGERSQSDDPVFDPKEDIAGPTVLGVAVAKEGEGGARGARIVVFADVDFLSKQLITSKLYLESGNINLLLNAVNWLAGRREDIGIEPKRYRELFASVTPDDRVPLFVGTVVGPALLMVVLGVIVWRVRSR